LQPGHSRRRGNWVRVRVKPQQQPDILETAESQNLATVAANQIPGETVLKQITKSPTNSDVIGNHSPPSSSSIAHSVDDPVSTPITESLNTPEFPGHQEDSFSSHKVASDLKYETTAVDGQDNSSDEKNAAELQEIHTNSPTIQGNGESSDNTRKHVTENSIVQLESGVTRPFDNGYSTDEITAARSENKDTTTESDVTNNEDITDEILSSWLVPPSGLDDPWNREEASEEIETPTTKQYGGASHTVTSTKLTSSWKHPSSNLEDLWNEGPSRTITKSANTDSDDSDSKVTVSLPDTTTSLPEVQDIESLLSSVGYYGTPKQDSDKKLNWGEYEDWWAKTYANHRPYYADDQSKLLEENTKKLQDSTSIWNMDSFKTYGDSNNAAGDVSGTSSTSLSNSTTEVTETKINASSLEDYPHYEVWEDIDKNHHSAKHSVKKADPQNLYEKHATIKEVESEHNGSSILDLLAATPGSTVQVADVTTTENSGEVTDFLEPSTEHSKLNVAESTPANSNLKETPYGIALSTTTEFAVVPSSDERFFSTEYALDDENVVGTDTSAYPEPKRKPLNAEHSTESSVSLSEPNVMRTDTRSLMAKILGTTTSTKISHETEICYRGRCIKTKTKDSDIDQFSID
jgi:hypothetical protein